MRLGSRSVAHPLPGNDCGAVVNHAIDDDDGGADGHRGPDLDAVARRAGLGPDLDHFPRGLETMLGERGITLSGGQKQRVALARALVLERPVLLLDDAFASVDPGTEERILEALFGLEPRPAILLATHRRSALGPPLRSTYARTRSWARLELST